MQYSASKNDRPRVGLALSGGAARGMAHVGVLRVLVEHGVPIDCVAGTSAGAIVGGAFAAGLSVAEIEVLARRLRWRDVGALAFSKLGVQNNERLEALMRSRLPITRFEDLELPFAAVATDLTAGKAVVLSNTGDIPFAIRASCTVPGWYVPVVDEKGRQLVDGGLIANIPTQALEQFGADIVIAVDVNAEGAKFLGTPQSAFGVIIQSFMVVQRHAAAQQLRDVDVVIRPRVGHLRWDEVTRADEFIQAGADAAQSVLAEIDELMQRGCSDVTDMDLPRRIAQ